MQYHLSFSTTPFDDKTNKSSIMEENAECTTNKFPIYLKILVSSFSPLKDYP